MCSKIKKSPTTALHLSKNLGYSVVDTTIQTDFISKDTIGITEIIHFQNIGITVA